MKTEDIEYNGMVFSCRKIIDISAMVELLSALARKQEYLEKKVNFQDQRIDDKDNRISELEIMIKGASQSKEEKFPSEKELTKGKEKEKEKEKTKEDEDLDSDLDAFLNKSEDNEKDDGKNEEKDKNKEGDENKDDVENDEVKNKSEEENEGKENEENEDKDKDNKKDGNEDDEKKEKDDNEDGKKKEKSDEDGTNKEKGENASDKDENANEDNEEVIEKNKEIDFNGNVTDKTKTTEANKENKNLTKAIDDQTKIDDKDSNSEILKKIIKKMKILETKITNLEKTEGANQSKKTTVIGSSGSGDNRRLNKKINELNEQIEKMKEEMEKMKEKVDDLNIYDLFKGGETGDANVDICKGLVMALENKVFKKFGFFDVKFKKNDTDIYQAQNDIKNINALLNGIKDREKKINDEMNEIKNNNESKYVDLNKLLKELSEKLNQLEEKMNKNNKTNSNEHKELSDRINELEQKMQQQNDNIDISKYVNVQGQMNPDDFKLLKELSQRINEVEKTLKITFSKFNPNEVNERLDNLETEMIKKSNKYEINEINEKLLYYDENEKDLNFKMDSLQQYNEKVRGDMQQIIKKIEYLSGELNRLINSNADADKGKGPILDLTKLVDINLFNENKKEVSKKFDKVRLSFEEIARNLDDILEKLSHTPSDSDFAQFQSIIKNMIEELKLSMSKKFADKTETNKSIKFLETQIKTIQESFTKKMEGADNWLLAKKPLNNYVCASCESIIRGELDKRSEYIPWNRYPNRDEKSYRMGHGFSRMLQMINEDKRRMQEIKEKDNLSDEGQSRSDSEQNFVVNGSVRLPKLKHKHLNSGKLKNSNNINNEEDNNNINSNIIIDKNNPYDDIDPALSSDRPKIMKIYKRTNKHTVQSSHQSRREQIKNTDNLPNLVVKTSPSEVLPKHGEKTESITQPNEE